MFIVFHNARASLCINHFLFVSVPPSVAPFNSEANTGLSPKDTLWTNQPSHEINFKGLLVPHIVSALKGKKLLLQFYNSPTTHTCAFAFTDISSVKNSFNTIRLDGLALVTNFLWRIMDGVVSIGFLSQICCFTSFNTSANYFIVTSQLRVS